MFASVDLTAAPAAQYESAPAWNLNIAVQEARALVAQAAGDRARVRFRRTRLKAAGDHLVFCGQVNAVFAAGPSGWTRVMIVVSDDPGMRGVVIDKGPDQRQLIATVCGRAAPVDQADYSTALSVW